MCANSKNHDRFLSLFTVLIESSFRHTTECVTGGNHLLEVCSSLKNRVENKIISHFWFCLPSPENHSGHPIEYTFTQMFGHYWLSVMVIYEYLRYVGLFTQLLQFVWHQVGFCA